MAGITDIRFLTRPVRGYAEGDLVGERGQTLGEGYTKEEKDNIFKAIGRTETFKNILGKTGEYFSGTTKAETPFDKWKWQQIAKLYDLARVDEGDWSGKTIEEIQNLPEEEKSLKALLGIPALAVKGAQKTTGFLFPESSEEAARDLGSGKEVTRGQYAQALLPMLEFVPGLGFVPVGKLAKLGLKFTNDAASNIKMINAYKMDLAKGDMTLGDIFNKIEPASLSAAAPKKIKNKAKLQTFFDDNPEVVEKFRSGEIKIPKMIELADLRQEYHIGRKGKLVSDETFKRLFRLTEQGGGKGPQAFVKGHWVGRPKGYMSPEQDTFLLNVINQRLKGGQSYEGLRSSLQKYIRDNPELLKQAEELKLTGYPDTKLQDRIKRLIDGKEKNLSEANQAIINTLREAKEAAPKKIEWHRLRESAIKNLSKENQKIALTYADEIINYAEPSLQSAVRKSTYGSLKRMIARAKTKKVGASEAEILEVLKNVDKEALSKIYQQQGTLANKIKEARELGVTIDDFGDIDLSHIADVANHWKLTMDADNLFFGFRSLNRSDQRTLNNQIDNILSEFPHAKNYSEKRELAKKMITIRKLLEENDLISVVRGKQIGKKDPTDPAFYEKKTKTLGELMQSQRQSQLIDEYGVKHGGLVGISHLTRPI